MSLIVSKLIFLSGIIAATRVAALPSDYYNNDIHTTYEEKSKPVEVPIYKKYAINIPYPVLTQQPPLMINQPRPIPIKINVPIDTIEPLVEEKKIEHFIDKPFPVFNHKKLEIPIFMPHVVYVPIYRHLYRH